MCGIAGVLNARGISVPPDLLRRMTDAIAHRGPDDEGRYLGGPVGLGNRRLAIIDPSPGGHQPMMSPSGDVVITYNGEVYNFREMRAELERARPSLPVPHRHRGCPARIRAVGSDSRGAVQRHVRLGDLGPALPAPLPRP